MKKFILTLAIWIGLTASAYATEMIMFSTNSCRYCRNFLREVAPTYNDTEYAKLLPLRIISMDNEIAPKWFVEAHEERRIDGISGTPTFVIFSNGTEVARLLGYSSKERWYAVIKEFIDNNREQLENTAGQNPIPYEKEHELDPKTASEKLINEEKSDDGVSLSNDIMDHQYKTPEEAIRAANKFECDSIHSHMIKGRVIWMPCKMQMQ